MTKDPRIYNGERTIPSINDVGKAGQLCAKQWNWSTILYGTKNLTKNGLKTWA